MDQRPEIKEWRLEICKIGNVQGEALIVVESDIDCLIDLVKVLMTSIKRVTLLGDIPVVDNYNMGEEYALTFSPQK